MQKRPRIPIFVLSTLFVIGAVVLGQMLVNQGKVYEEKILEHHNSLRFEERLLDMDEWLDTEGVAEAKMKKAAALQEVADEASEKMTSYGLMIGGSAVIFLGVMFFAFRGENRLYALTMSSLVLAITFLYVGITAPMLEISGFYENLHVPAKFAVFGAEIDFSHTFTGNVFFSYETKGILGVISVLFSRGSAFVGICILLASVVIPVTKLALSFIILIRDDYERTAKLRRKMTFIGKFSMLDVMVVSLFLALLGFNGMQTNVQLEAKFLPGVYFFAIYVILSLASSVLLDRTLKQAVKPQ